MAKIRGTAAGETLNGEMDRDSIWGDGGNDFLYCNDGDDVVYGEKSSMSSRGAE